MNFFLFDFMPYGEPGKGVLAETTKIMIWEVEKILKQKLHLPCYISAKFN